MATIDMKVIIDELIANDGYFDSDPRVVKIVEYTNFAGNTCWGIVYENEPRSGWDRYEIPTTYVRNPKVIWCATT